MDAADSPAGDAAAGLSAGATGGVLSQLAARTAKNGRMAAGSERMVIEGSFAARGRQDAAPSGGGNHAPWCSSSQRSTSIAAMQPEPAAVTAWR